MTSLIFGIFLFIICLIGYFFAYWFSRQQKYTYAIATIILCGLLLRLYTGFDLYLHDWDEKYHALVAKNLINHPFKPTLYDNPLLPYQLERWVENNVWLEKGPIPLWNCAVSLRLFGLNEVAVRIPAIVLSTIAILLTFLIGKLLFNRKVGLMASFLHSVNGLLIEVAGGRVSSDMVETTFIFFVELGVFIGVYAIIHRKLYLMSMLIGFITGCSLLCKWSPGLIVIPVWLAGAYFSKKYTIKQLFLCIIFMSVSCGLTFSAWIIYILNTFPQEAKFVLRKFLFAYNKSFEGHEAPFYYYFDHILRMIFGELVYIPLLLSLYFLFWKRRRWQLILISVWWLVPIVIFSFGAMKRQTYMLISAPAIFLIISFCWFYLKSVREKVKFKWVVSIVLFLLIALPVRYCIERVKPFERRDRNPDWAVKARSLRYKIPAGNNVVIFNVEKNIEIMFYNDCTAYQKLPSLDTLKQLQSQGCLVIVNDNGNLPSEYHAAGLAMKLGI